MVPATEVSSLPAAEHLSLRPTAARALATTTKTAPQMRERTPRWLVRSLPWVDVPGGSYRVNRRLSYVVGDGRVTFTNVGSVVRVIPRELRELPVLRDFDDVDALQALADRFVQQEFAPGELLVEYGAPADQIMLVAHGKVEQVRPGDYGADASLGLLGDGDHFGAEVLAGVTGLWNRSLRALTHCTVLTLRRQNLHQVGAQLPTLRAHLARMASRPGHPQNRHGEAAIAISAGHDGEPELPGTFVDYDTAPREYELSLAQTLLRVHTRVADLYNQPMDQVEQQIRLTVEALRERQEHELLNNPDFGLLHNADLTQRRYTRTGPPTPDDLDDILTRRRRSRFFVAHPRAIAAFGRECNKRGVLPSTVEVQGRPLMAWRGVPLLPSDKIPIDERGLTSILVMRTGEDDQGVVGLRRTGLPDEYEPGLNVRFTGIDDRGIISYLVSTYHSAAVLVPDALGVLDNVEVSR